MGLKCVAIYRDGSKRSQPLNTKRTNDGAPEAKNETESLQQQLTDLQAEVAKWRLAAGQPLRRRLPETRQAITHKFDIAGHEGYFTVGLFDDRQPGEIFITMAKEGSTIGGLMDSIGTLTSMALQYGVPLEALVRKFAHQRFEPSGYTKNPDIRICSSIIDYVFRWMANEFIPGYREATNPNRNQPELVLPNLEDEMKKKVNRPVGDLPPTGDRALPGSNSPSGSNGNSNGHGRSHMTILTATFINSDAPTCPSCGHVAVRNGACYKCLNCGESLGCS